MVAWVNVLSERTNNWLSAAAGRPMRNRVNGFPATGLLYLPLLDQQADAPSFAA